MYSLIQLLESAAATGEVNLDINSLLFKHKLIKHKFLKTDCRSLTCLPNMHSMTYIVVCERKISVGDVLPLFIADDDLLHFGQAKNDCEL